MPNEPTSALLPCPVPWCGGVANYRRFICIFKPGDHYDEAVVCTKCGCSTNVKCPKRDGVDVVVLWNNRPTPTDPEVAALVEAMEGLLAGLGPEGYVLPAGAQATHRARQALTRLSASWGGWQPDGERIIALSDDAGDFVTGEDGCVIWWPDEMKRGGMNAWHLRALANELDKRNAGWFAELSAAFANTPKDNPHG